MYYLREASSILPRRNGYIIPGFQNLSKTHEITYDSSNGTLRKPVVIFDRNKKTPLIEITLSGSGKDSIELITHTDLGVKVFYSEDLLLQQMGAGSASPLNLDGLGWRIPLKSDAGVVFVSGASEIKAFIKTKPSLPNGCTLVLNGPLSPMAEEFYGDKVCTEFHINI